MTAAMAPEAEMVLACVAAAEVGLSTFTVMKYARQGLIRSERRRTFGNPPRPPKVYVDLDGLRHLLAQWSAASPL